MTKSGRKGKERATTMQKIKIGKLSHSSPVIIFKSHKHCFIDR